MFAFFPLVFSECRVNFLFRFLHLQSGRFFSVSLRIVCMLSLFVVRLCSRWNQSIFQIIFGANPL